MGSMPISVTIGRRIGVRIRIAGVVSMTIPTISRKMLITRSKSTGLEKCARIQSLTAWGTCIRVRTLENAMDAARINRMGV